MGNINFIESIKRLSAIADTGLLYASSGFEKERYEELKHISLDMLSQLSDTPLEVLSNYYLPSKDYPTVKVDVRAFVLNDKKEILFVKEQSDQRWSIPGGWADIGFSPSEAVVKEVKEETGLDILPVRLLAVFDTKVHPHPPQPFYIYKIIILCTLLSTDLNKGFDILDTGFFSLSQLPPLSENRIVQPQIELLYKRIMQNETETLFD